MTSASPKLKLYLRMDTTEWELRYAQIYRHQGMLHKSLALRYIFKHLRMGKRSEIYPKLCITLAVWTTAREGYNPKCSNVFRGRKPTKFKNKKEVKGAEVCMDGGILLRLDEEKES